MIDFNDYRDKKLSMLFSGGVESSLLYYLLADFYKEKELSLYVIDRFNSPVGIAFNVFDMINTKINYHKGSLKKLVIPKIPNHLEIPFATKILLHKYDYIIWGLNKYPDDTSIRPKFLSSFKENDYIKLPFANIKKDVIIKKYYDLGIEDILNNTRSCGLNYEIPCKKCFNCRERAWAYNKLNLPINYGL